MSASSVVRVTELPAVTTTKGTVMRKPRQRTWQGACLVAVGAAGLMAATVPSVSATTAGNNFTQTNLVANNSSFGAKLVDPNLTNAWGLAAGPNEPLWVSDN